MQIRVSLGFASAADHALEESAGALLVGLYVSPLWAVPPEPPRPVTQLQLETALTTLTEAIAAQSQGGTAATAAKNNARDGLITLLRQLAGYVQENHDNDLGKLLASGFEAVSTNRAQSPLEKPNIRDIRNDGEGRLKVRVFPVRNARMWEMRYALIDAAGTPGPWLSAGIFNSTRALLLTGLTPGGLYKIEVRALGGSTGHSDWSDPVSHRSL